MDTVISNKTLEIFRNEMIIELKHEKLGFSKVK